jgi:hypothetical protein
MLTPYKIEDYFKEFHPIWAVKMKDVRQKMYWSHLSIPFIDWLSIHGGVQAHFKCRT